MSKLKLKSWDLSDFVRSMMKTRQNNDVTDCIDVVYAETETELSGPIESGTICYEKQVGQRHDRSSGVMYTKNKTKL